jgi:hypothetical protein
LVGENHLQHRDDLLCLDSVVQPPWLAFRLFFMTALRLTLREGSFLNERALDAIAALLIP